MVVALAVAGQVGAWLVGPDGHACAVDVDGGHGAFAGVGVDRPAGDGGRGGRGRHRVQSSHGGLVGYDNSAAVEQCVVTRADRERERAHRMGPGAGWDERAEPMVGPEVVHRIDIGSRLVCPNRHAGGVDVDRHHRPIGGVGIECPARDGDTRVRGGDRIHGSDGVVAVGVAKPVREVTEEIPVAVRRARASDTVPGGECCGVRLVGRVVVQARGRLVLDEHAARAATRRGVVPDLVDDARSVGVAARVERVTPKLP